MRNFLLYLDIIDIFQFNFSFKLGIGPILHIPRQARFVQLARLFARFASRQKHATTLRLLHVSRQTRFVQLIQLSPQFWHRGLTPICFH